jgi:acetylornithine/N-succinyldiaminopimelate aminotransferase
VPSAAALAHLRVRDASDFDAHVLSMGAVLLGGLSRIADRYPSVFDAPRGMGLMLGLPVRAPYAAKAFVDRARESHRLLLNAAGENTLRFVPPLVIDERTLLVAIERLENTIAAVVAASGAS